MRGDCRRATTVANGYEDPPVDVIIKIIKWITDSSPVHYVPD